MQAYKRRCRAATITIACGTVDLMTHGNRNMQNLKHNPNADDAAAVHLRYRPDIDGLRAIAVLGVLFFHAGLGFPGGYVGVDVFFVISGFLITSLLLKDLDRGTFSMLHFWERRIRRILPALAVVVTVILAAGWFLLLPRDYEELGKQVISMVACASNVKFWLESGYFDVAAEQKPLLHTWSLAVEEQFYLVIPLVLALLFRIRKIGWILPLLVGGILGSFALSVYGSYRHPPTAFFLLPFRAWELGMGSLLVFLPPCASGRLAHAAAWLGLAGIVATYFLYPPGIRFPGISALPPVVGAALLIWAGSNRDTRTPGHRDIVFRLLASRPLVWIGLLSYSLYLWHWPLFAFQKYLGLPAKTWWIQLGLVLASFPLAWLSLRFVETPFRSRRLVKSRRSVFELGGGVLASLVLVSVILWRTGGAELRLSEAERRIAASQMDSAFINELTAADVPARLVPVGKPGGTPHKH
ncbi:MAG: acyltransferase [Verrucomicrobiales bacterium]|nr:acyltransferase [Verrucomicrobiales bacterium]